MRRKLPLYVEQSLQEVQAHRIDLAEVLYRKYLGNSPISCSAGCSSCCHHPVLITILEAIPLYGALVEHGLWVPSFKDKLQKHAEMVSHLNVQVWLLSKIPCPLLAKDRCVAYEARPFACRVTIATGDPYYCDPQRLGAETTIVPRTDITAMFREREEPLLRKHGLVHLNMPLSRALLMAERVCNGQVMLESTDRTYMLEHLTDQS